MYLGSEESILEYEPERSAGAGAAAVAATAGIAGAIAGGAPRRLSATNRVGTGALTDLIRSRDFVIDFPRIFVLEAGGATGTRETLFPTRLPERSQSTLSLSYAKDWMSLMTNKLEEQQGIRRMRKPSARNDMQENLLDVSSDSIKKRRSRSADGRYSSGYFGRKELARQMAAAQVTTVDETTGAPTDGGSRSSRRNSKVMRGLTEASYAPSKQRQREELDLVNARLRSGGLRRNSDISLRELPRRHAADDSFRLTGDVGSAERAGCAGREGSPTMDVGIRIEINGEGVDLA